MSLIWIAHRSRWRLIQQKKADNRIQDENKKQFVMRYVSVLLVLRVLYMPSHTEQPTCCICLARRFFFFLCFSFSLSFKWLWLLLLYVCLFVSFSHVQPSFSNPVHRNQISICHFHHTYHSCFGLTKLTAQCQYSCRRCLVSMFFFYSFGWHELCAHNSLVPYSGLFASYSSRTHA